MWTQIKDDTGGGHSITGFSLLFMECPYEEALAAFEAWTGQDHARSTPEYGSIIDMREFDSLQEASAYQRGCGYDNQARRWTEGPGSSWQTYQPFEAWLEKQLMDPSPEAMREKSQEWNGDRHAQSAVARLPFLGALLLPHWLGAIGEFDPYSDEEFDELASDQAQSRLADWGRSMEAMADKAVWSPQRSSERALCAGALLQAGAALREAVDERPGAWATLAEPLAGLENAWIAVFNSGDWELVERPQALAELLCELRLPGALQACAIAFAPRLGEAGRQALSALCAQLDFGAGHAALEAAASALRPEPLARAAPRRSV